MSSGGSITQLFHPTAYRHCSETLSTSVCPTQPIKEGLLLKALTIGAGFTLPVIVPTVSAADALGGVSLRHCRVHPTTLKQEDSTISGCESIQETVTEKGEGSSVSAGAPKTLHFQTLITLSIFRSMSRNMAWQH